jgi:SSS family solute:Na+ symporter
LGIFHKRINATGAFATLIIGIIIAALRVVLELVKESLDPAKFLFKMGNMNFLTFGAWFFLFCIVFATVISLLTPAPSREKVVNLTFGTITAEEKAKNQSSYTWMDITISIIVVAIVIGVMIFFNGN